MKKHIPVLFSCLAVTAVIAQVAAEKAELEDSKVVKSSDVPWGALNPARGSKGPRAGALWNDRTGDKASGFLVRFTDGFSSPPHIHNVTYRGVVLRGLVHNDDPDAEEMWMPEGSFWTQPAGEVHITSAKGEDVMAYIEIDSGPYLVLPEEEAFDKGERPVNIVPSNLVWLSSSQTNWIVGHTSVAGASEAEIAFLWGKPASDATNGSFLRLPKGYEGVLESKTGSLRVVVVKGRMNGGELEGKMLDSLGAGEYFLIPTGTSLRITTGEEDECVMYIQADGSYLVDSSK